MTEVVGAARPRFSIVAAIHNVERYLPEFIASIEQQRVAPDDLEVIAVDDGSTDDSRGLLNAWARDSRYRIWVLQQENAGQGAARNRGLLDARGEWVTFADPDDRLGPTYLPAIEAFARAHADVELIAGHPILHLEAEGRVVDRHPRWKQYRHGNRVVDLDDEPNDFPGSTHVGFYRVDRLRSAGITFDPRIRPNFEDGHFAATYVLSLERPVVGLVRDAEYLYRKRADQSSALQRSLRDQRRYTTVLELGYLDVIGRAIARHGRVPEWLQQMLIYELSWYLAEEEKIASGAYLEPDIVPRFHELLDKILVHLDPEVVSRHRTVRIGSVMADVLAHAGRPGAWHSDYVVQTRIDAAMRLRRISYRFRGSHPSEELSAAGRLLDVAFAKTMAHRYYDRAMLSERILWIPLDGPLEVRLDGRSVPVLGRWPATGRRRRRVRSGWRRRLRRLRRLPIRAIRTVSAVVRGRITFSRATARFLRTFASRPPYRGRFRDAWLFQDRIHDADDNGERLFEYVRRERPDINAWFVIEPGTPDWHRLRVAGERRLLAHGSFAWKMAMLNCSWLLSSHADLPIFRPPALTGTGPATWRYGFIEHGIIKDDLSVWLNRREMELFVASTEAELESIAGDGTAYRFTHKETRNTGLPRFDRLLAKSNEVPEDERTLVIIAPTWRQWLARSLHSGSQRRKLESAFWNSDYLVNWMGLLRSPQVEAAIRQRGWRLGFMPHPNLQAMLPELDLPGHVEPLSFAGTDVQGLYARCALLVTDYSSVAFNTAYIDRPLVYFQFDRDRMLGGAHVGRHGYFDYERDGYGPVAVELDAAIRAVVEAIERGPRPSSAYQARIDAAFPVRDGRACERVVAAVEELSRPWVRRGPEVDPGSDGP